MPLTKEQQDAYDLILSGKNVFLTGNAGTGKSFVLDEVIKHYQEEGIPYIASAPTGIAAFNIKGITLHSLLHIRPGILTGSPSYATQKAWRDLFFDGGILIVDEISMCRLDLFEYLIKTIKATEDYTHRHIQLILVGDFYQLPPIVQRNEAETYGKYFSGIYPFESSFWNVMNFHNIILHQEIRQKQRDDREKWFVQALNHIRFNDRFALNAIQYINRECYKPTLDDKGTYLCGYKRSVDQINSEHLRDLSGHEVTFHNYHDDTITKGSFPANDVLHIKIGARVMCLKNVTADDGSTVYNGQQGTVINALAHGKLLSESETNLNDKAPNASVFKSAEKGDITPLLDAQDNSGVLVKFDGTKTQEGITTWISWDHWDKIKYEVDKKGKLKQKVVGTFAQIPLKLSYALTIHKAQGQTIRGSVNLKSEIFAPGQLYVGLSRVTSINNLHLQSPLRPKDAIPNVKVTEFYKQIDPQMASMNVHYDRQNLLNQLGTIVNELPDDKLAQFVNLANMFK